jgi:Secretion system C-terminal sorting domain
VFKNNEGDTVVPYLVNTGDSAFFYLDVSNANSGSFWQSSKMEQYRLCFANISNIQWYARKKPCDNIDFSVEIKKNSDGCFTRLKTVNSHQIITWRVFDAGEWYEYKNQQVLDLPAFISPNASITLKDQSGCFITKRLADFPEYLKNREACASGAAISDPVPAIIVYPNPGTGVFMCRSNGELLLADNITIFNSAGIRVAHFTNTDTFNISNLPRGIYIYQILTDKTSFSGKVIKQ